MAENELLDTNAMHVIYALSALDTEMNQLHKLCLEQGLFFKNFFPVAMSDSLGYGLKEHAPHQSPNASHLTRTYWRSKIYVYEIQNISTTYMNILKEWVRMYGVLTDFKMNPTAFKKPESENGLSEFNKNLKDLVLRICQVCDFIQHFTTTSTPSRVERGYAQPANMPLDGLLQQLKTTM